MAVSLLNASNRHLSNHSQFTISYCKYRYVWWLIMRCKFELELVSELWSFKGNSFFKLKYLCNYNEPKSKYMYVVLKDTFK